MIEIINIKSIRSRKARISVHIGDTGNGILKVTAFLLILAGLYCLTLGELARLGYIALSIASACAMISLWYTYALKQIPSNVPASTLDDITEKHLLARLKEPLTPHAAWEIAVREPEGQFVCNHLFLDPHVLGDMLTTNEKDMELVWRQAEALLKLEKPDLHAGILVAALLLTSADAQSFLTHYKLKNEDILEVLDWLDRRLSYIHQSKPYFGGIGRDWATGFTPTLEQFGQNISRSVEATGGITHFFAHADLLDGLVSNLQRDTGIALIAPDGAGKTTLVYGLAQRLLEGRDPQLQYYQIISLNASLILSYSGQQLERLMLNLFGEAVTAGNIIIFLDDAQLFFSSGVGSFDMSQILLPVIKNRNVKIIAAMSPTDWQQMQAQREALANSFASITLTEPTEKDTYKVIEDTALTMERRNGLLITYEAVREAYRLSGQYMQERAYPGKAVSLLEQAIPYAHDAITAETVQAAIESTKGIKVSAAKAPEADMLLHLEDRIHERMINQKRAVNVVAAALRRGRAGVSNPKRPVGSFLFLGPTGVGKTELARSLAAVYFSDEKQMIRLDMSEYQRPEDVTRLLATGGQHERSLLLAIREQPFSVVLLDEIEKAHPNILNLLLQMLDEGQLTDEQGRPASFRSSIIIATSNAGANDITAQVRTNGNLDNFERPLLDKLIAGGQFKPELVNRFDEVVLFRPLNEEELGQVANVMLREVNKTLALQQISVQLTPAALQQIVHAGYDPEFGARPMRRIIQKTVENAVAVKILRGEVQPGATITLDMPDVTIE